MSVHHNLGISTRLVHAGDEVPWFRAVVPPTFETASYVFDDLTHHDQVLADPSSQPFYSRIYNPTVAALETKLATVDSAESALAFSSGMAAITTTLSALCLGGGHLVVSDQLFGTTTAWLRDSFSAPMHFDVSIVDFRDIDAVRGSIRANTVALFFEEFTNPLLRVVDLPAIVAVAREAHVLTVVDNTFASPVLIRPLEHGADLVIHSTTKFFAGHGHVVGGVVAGSRGLLSPIERLRSQIGTIMTPHNAASTARGMATLELRVHRMCSNAQALAELADQHPATSRVNYPGLADDPNHETAARLTQAGFGGVLSFHLTDPQQKRRVYDAFELMIRATSLGDVSSLVDSFDSPDLLRISAGIEDPADLLADLGRALDQAVIGC